MTQQEKERLKSRFWAINPMQGDDFFSKPDAERRGIIDEMKQIANLVRQDATAEPHDPF